jgi:hypothetical protein
MGKEIQDRLNEISDDPESALAILEITERIKREEERDNEKRKETGYSNVQSINNGFPSSGGSLYPVNKKGHWDLGD